MKEKFKKLWDFILPIIKGWTIKGMIKLIEKEGYCVCKPEECKKKK